MLKYLNFDLAHIYICTPFILNNYQIKDNLSFIANLKTTSIMRNSAWWKSGFLSLILFGFAISLTWLLNSKYSCQLKAVFS